MTKSELIDKLTSEIPSLETMSAQEVNKVVDHIIKYVISTLNREELLESGNDRHEELETMEYWDIEVKPLSTRRVKVKKVHKKDPYKFVPPDEDDFLIDID